MTHTVYCVYSAKRDYYVLVYVVEESGAGVIKSKYIDITPDSIHVYAASHAIEAVIEEYVGVKHISRTKFKKKFNGMIDMEEIFGG